MTAYYLQTNIMCIAFLLVVYKRLINKRETISAQRLAFKYLMWSAMLMCVSDTLAWLSSGKTVAGAVFWIELFNILYFMSVSCCCFIWMLYVNIRLNGPEYNHRRDLIYGGIPMVLITAIICTNPFTGYMFKITEGNVYERGSMVWLHWLVSWGYLVAAEVKVIVKLRKTSSRSAREKLMPLLWFMVAPAIAAFAQMMVYGVTTTQCGITFSIVLIAYGFLQDKVSLDALTGLNNRAALEAYFGDRIQKSGTGLTLLMCDVDGFKLINDSLGHLMGDVALKAIANVLKKACGACKASVFLCRYGGDEFIIGAPGLTGDDINWLKNTIQSALDEYNSGSKNVFALEVSMGEATGVCSSYDDVEKLIHEADEKMYENKASRKRLRTA